MSLHPVPSGEESEALRWLIVAKRVLSGEICPDEVRDALNFGNPYLEDFGVRNDPQV